MTQTPPDIRERLLNAALDHVPFDGWSEATFRAAYTDIGVDEQTARAAYPRGAVGLAAAFHQRGDERMRAHLQGADLAAMRVRDKITFAVRTRLEQAGGKEVVRRGTTLFALPHHAAEGAALIWGTADAVWEALGDSSEDVNWYTKRATLAGVYGSTVLFWLGDRSPGDHATWEFLDRRIEDVMRIEKLKAQVRDNALLQRAFAGPNWLLSQIKAPRRAPRTDVPGRWPAQR